MSLRLLTAALLLATSQVRGEEIVSLASPASRQARARIKGEVIDYTGEQIVIKLADGREITRPGNLVTEIESDWPPGQCEADRLYAEHRFEAAREQYTAAIRHEQRRWVRRKLFARLIACHRELGQFDAAGKLFLALAHDDPQTPYFDHIPLGWLPGEPSPALEQAAVAWLNDDNPLAGLLGASHLLAASRRAAALERLGKLMTEKDPRISCLAEAQTWRANLVTADNEQLARWHRRVEQFPESLRAGPYWVIGRALARRGAADEAGLMLLRLPVLYPECHTLAADALAGAASLVENQGDAGGAARLRHELLAAYGDTRPAKQIKAQQPDEQGDEPQQRAETIARPTAESLDQAFLTGLRARRLFALATRECTTRLADSGLDPSQRIALAVEQSRTFVEQALEKTPDQRGLLWAQALEAVGSGARPAKIKGSRALLLDAQLGLVHLAVGEVMRQEAEIAGSPEERVEAARGELRAAVSTFERVVEQAAAALRRISTSKRGDPAELDASELMALERNVGFQWARALRNQGQSYPPQSADRTNSLRQAAEKFAALGGGDTHDDVAWRSRLDEIACLRLLEDFPAATARLAQLASLDPPRAMEPDVRAEQIRLALAVRRLPDALRGAEAASDTTSPSANLDYARLEAYAAAWRAAAEANDELKSSQWQDRAAALVRQIDERYGPYWSRRADMLLAGGLATGGSGNLTLLVRAAESFYRHGQIDQALSAYDQAAALATQNKNPDAAFEQLFTAAAIEQDRQRHRQAAERFRRLALSLPEHPRAGEVHLLAIYNAAHVAAAAGPAPAELDELTLLQEHLQRWPSSASANQARVWLGQLNERKKNWSGAIAAYRGVAPDDEHAAEAIEAIARCYTRWLSELSGSGKPTLGVASEAARSLEGLVLSPRGDLPERWSQTERVAATSAAALWLQYTDDFDRAERLLSAALADADEAPAEWKTAARSLEVFALAAQGRRDEAAKKLSDVAGGAPDQLLLVIEGLSRIAGKSAPAVRRELAELQLQAAELARAKRDALSPAQRKALDRALIRGLAAAGRLPEAVESAKKFAASLPRDGEAQEEYARLLVEAADWSAALTAWRAIQQKCREGSGRWLRSVYFQALALEGLDKQAEAARLIKVTEALHPELGGPDQKARFHELLKRCRG